MVQLKFICILVLSVISVIDATRISCYTCKGEEGCEKEIIALNECLHESDTCTTIFFDNKISNKGCSSTLTKECTTDEDTNCFQCKSTECNTAKSVTDYIDCTDCTSKNNQDCALGKVAITKKCHKSCMAYFVLDAIKKKSILIRTCLDDIEKSKQDECGKDKDSLCYSCHKPTCNKASLTEKLLECKKCDDIETCKKPEIEFCNSDPTKDQCYAIYDKSNIKTLGCLSSNDKLTEAEIAKLKAKNEIFLCAENNCNALENLPKMQQCRICNSKTDRNCVQDIKDMKSTVNCEVENNQACYTRILPDKSTDRGCYTNLKPNEKPNCKDDKTNGICIACNKPDCNNEVFPENRQTCHICNSIEDKNCATTDPKNEKVCEIYNKNDECISKIDENVVYRGCASKFEYPCHDKDSSCRLCKMNNCNVIDFQHVIDDTTNYGMWQELPLTCLTCNGDKCKTTETTTNTKCQQNDEDCVTVFNNDNSIIMRGCENEVYSLYEQYCHQNPDLCFNCKSSNCNIATDKNDFISCTYCGWRNGPSCNTIDNKNLKNYSNRKCYKSCMTALYKHTDDVEPAYNLIRTCTDDKLPESQKNCATSIDDENSLCLTCEGANCNQEVYPKNRESCYMCNGVANCKKPNSDICPLHSKNDQCYYIYNENEVVAESGCKSTLEKQVIDDLLIVNKIGLCKGKDCNSVENQPKDGECVVCDSKDNVDCAIDPSHVNTTTVCKAPNTKCFVRINKDGDTERGCLLSLKEDMNKCDSKNNCEICTDSESCNKKVYPENRRACLVCSSKHDKNCHKTPKTLQICPIYIPDEKCVSTYKNKETIRGCGQSLKCDDEKSEKTCDICGTNDCNTVDLKKRNGSGNIMGNFMIISLLSIGLIILSNKNY